MDPESDTLFTDSADRLHSRAFTADMGPDQLAFLDDFLARLQRESLDVNRSMGLLSRSLRQFVQSRQFEIFRERADRLRAAERAAVEAASAGALRPIDHMTWQLELTTPELKSVGRSAPHVPSESSAPVDVPSHDADEVAGLWARMSAGPGRSDGATAGAVGDLRPCALLVCENRQSVVALPDMPGVVALAGGGDAVSELQRLAWAADRPVVYRGDLDADGFRILNRLRHHHARVSSVLMDVETLDSHVALRVPDPRVGRTDPAATDLLTEAERRAAARLHNLGDVRLEQERLAWPWVRSRVAEALDRALE